MFCNLLTEQCEKHFLYDLQLCASCLVINFKDFLDHVRVIIYYTITSLSRLHHSIIICCSRKIANNMKGSISPCSPLTTRARRVCHANRPREYSKGPQIITQPVDVINRRWTKTILRYSNATVRGKKNSKTARECFFRHFKNNLLRMRPPDRWSHRTQMAKKGSALTVEKVFLVSSSAIFPQTVSGDFFSFSMFKTWSLGRNECEVKLKAKTKSAIRNG